MSKSSRVLTSKNKSQIDNSLRNMKQTGETFKSIAGRFEGLTVDALKAYYYKGRNTNDRANAESLTMSPDSEEQPLKSALLFQNGADNGVNSGPGANEPKDRRAKLEEMLEQAIQMYYSEIKASDYKGAKASQPIILGFLNSIAQYDASHGVEDDNVPITLVWADQVKARENHIEYQERKALPASPEAPPLLEDTYSIRPDGKHFQPDSPIPKPAEAVNAPAQEGYVWNEKYHCMERKPAPVVSSPIINPGGMTPAQTAIATGKEPGIVKVGDVTFETFQDGPVKGQMGIGNSGDCGCLDEKFSEVFDFDVNLQPRKQVDPVDMVPYKRAMTESREAV